MGRRLTSWLGALSLLAVLSGTATASFTTFDTGQVRPLAMSPDGTRLFACNTPDDRVDIFSIGAGGALTRTGSVTVGVEPVAVAARTNNEIWVVNHLSDSISIVDVTPGNPARVVRTLLVGDEPRDLLFAGPGRNRAFVTTARRGQNAEAQIPANLTTPSTPRALVWVFDATNLGASLEGTPLTIIPLFTDTPRALAVNAAGDTVYAAGFHTGNQTTTLNEGLVCDGGSGAAACTVFGSNMPGGLPAPNVDANNVVGPETGLIVKFNGTHWVDQLGRNWDNGVRFTLPDQDVFAIDANANPPAQTTAFAHVGTILFNMAVNPVSGKVYVTNSDANNAVRFEGPGSGGSTVRGHIAEMRITVLDGANVLPRHLNKHINYAIVPSPGGTAANSLSMPLEMAVTANGQTLYVAAFGSGKVGIFNTAQLEADTFTPSAANHVAVSGGGPSGLVLDEARQRLYVYTRFDNALSVIDTVNRLEVSHTFLHNPEPASVVDGRPLLYDSLLTSSNGEASCASCHIFNDFDSLAWDLGNPDDVVLHNPNPFRLLAGNPDFHPLKGPMTTQSLRGMANHGPMHWRGDRTGGNDPGGNSLDEDAAFKKFNPAFTGLVGRSAQLTPTQMQRFTDFILQVKYPPNPVRKLDNSLTAAQQSGRTLYFGANTDTLFNCNGCHVLNPAQGFFGSDGFSSFENETQDLKVPHLRNIYQKVGMFGMPRVPFLRAGNNGAQGPQVRGFGFLHDGSIDTTFRFHGATVFSVTPTDQSNLEQFMLAFDSDLAPVVGQQVTLTSANGGVAGPRIDLLIARAAAGECELVVKGNISGQQRGSLRLANGQFRSDRSSEPLLSDAQVRALASTAGQELTYSCVPVGSGSRIGIDRDEDTCLDRDELDGATDPSNGSDCGLATTTSTSSTTTSTTTSTTSPSTTIPFVTIRTTALKLKDDNVPPPDATKRQISFRSATKLDGSANRIILPAANGPGDPTLFGAQLEVYNSAGLTPDHAVVALPAGNWTRLGTPVTAYKFTGAPGAAISKLLIKADSIRAKGGSFNFNYSLNEPSQGRVAVRLTLGTAIHWCADAPPKPSGHGPLDVMDKFIAQPKTPPPFACPPAP